MISRHSTMFHKSQLLLQGSRRVLSTCTLTFLPLFSSLCRQTHQTIPVRSKCFYWGPWSYKYPTTVPPTVMRDTSLSNLSSTLLLNFQKSLDTTSLFYPDPTARQYNGSDWYHTGYLETTCVTDNNKGSLNQQTGIGCKYLSGNNLPWIKLIRGKLFPAMYLLPMTTYWFQ